MQQKTIRQGGVIIILFQLFFSFHVKAQYVPLTEAKEGDYVINYNTRMKAFVISDEGSNEAYINQRFLFVLDVHRDSLGQMEKIRLTGGRDMVFELLANDEAIYYEDLMVCDTCDPKGFYVPYICNDSLSMWSSHKSRPFLYGFNYSKEKCEQFIPDIKFMEIQPSDKIASVGAASGWYEGALSVNTENVSYTIEDVDKYLLNEKQFNGVVNHFTSVRESEQTNTFDYVLGTFDSTGLPRGKFDKIIIRNAYHEFDKKWKMIHDLKSKLNPVTGKIILKDESFSSLYYSHFHSGCDRYSNQLKSVMQFFAAQGLYLEKMHLPMNSLDNDVIFGLDKKKSNEYLKSLEETNRIMLKVDRLNTSFYASNFDYVDDVEILLKENLNLLHTTYDSLHYYLSDIGSNWTETEHYQYALNVLEISNHLYPNIAYTNFYLGIAYYGLEDRQMGDDYFAKCISLDSSRKEEVEKFKKQWIEWWGEQG